MRKILRATLQHDCNATKCCTLRTRIYLRKVQRNATSPYRGVAVLHVNVPFLLPIRKILRVQQAPKQTRKILQKGLE